MKIEELIKEANETARKQGLIWTWDDVARQLMWATSELGEAFEAWRHEDFDHVLEEIADCFITLADLIGDIDKEGKFISILKQKLEYNKTRPKYHGAPKP